MNQPTTQATTTETATPTVDGGFEARLSALKADIGSPETAGETAPDGAAPPSPAGASASDQSSPAALADPEAQKRAEERRRALEAFQLRERERVADKTRQTQAERMQADLAAALKRAEDAEKARDARFDRAMLKDPVAAIREMEREGVPADKVAEALREALTNPAATASREVREAISPELAAFKKQNAELLARIEAFEQREQEREQKSQDEQNTRAFLGFVQQNAQRAPLASRLLQQDQEEFMAIASIAGERVPEGAGPEALLLAVEDALDTEVRGIAQKYGGLFQALTQPTNTSQTTAPTPPSHAAAKANTVTNSLAQGRTAIVDEESDWAALPFEERLARMRRSV